MRHAWRQYRVRKKFATAPTGLAEAMRARLEKLLREVYGNRWHRLDAKHLGAAVNEQTHRAEVSDDAIEWFVLLVLRSPAATRAQQYMDTHEGGYHSSDKNLYELIDFNDAFVSTVIALSVEQRQDFIEVSRHEIARFCAQVGARMFSEEQFEAITRGLSREVAVYLGALQQGFDVVMTSRRQDAMGVDMIVTDPVSKHTLNIDCKTSSSFHYRLKDLVREGRMSPDEASQAELHGYAREVNGHGDEAVMVTLIRIDPNEVGDVKSFVFTQPELLGERLRALFSQTVAQ